MLHVVGRGRFDFSCQQWMGSACGFAAVACSDPATVAVLSRLRDLSECVGWLAISAVVSAAVVMSVLIPRSK